MAENDLISKCALLRHLDMAIDCKDCPRNINKDLYTCNMRTTSEGCTCSEVSQICCRITNFVSDAQPVKQWVELHDRHPDTEGFYLVCDQYGECEVAEYLPDIKSWFTHKINGEIRYWMPLPEPPKGGDAT